MNDERKEYNDKSALGYGEEMAQTHDYEIHLSFMKVEEKRKNIAAELAATKEKVGPS